jgi:hypothetical protein
MLYVDVVPRNVEHRGAALQPLWREHRGGRHAKRHRPPAEPAQRRPQEDDGSVRHEHHPGSVDQVGAAPGYGNTTYTFGSLSAGGFHTMGTKIKRSSEVIVTNEGFTVQ